ncbi:LysR family transcriptional regulator [Lacimicrobium alkaliphilum]|uniref:LysR family transcriptional regulator n=1 Tax=Lacimicrobium alkaliphilum TaxID=1526571 RepID=A0A0U3BD28_9ALTE|nr:LysR family transcriptional regulator [Lacimicrobium alkaliphilum]ALS99573.1 LysR family transcriptional regulator [Lacimicrobium alkaliphilum]
MDTNEALFIRIVEAGSLKAAAEQLGTDPSNVSRRIAALEHRLQVRLLQRSTRRSSPTEAGSIYYEGLRRLLDEQQALESKLRGARDTPSGLLKVAAPHDFGSHFIAPVLQEMVRTAPDLQVELILGSQFEDLRAQGIDVAVRIGQLPDSSLICRRLGNVPRVIVASPDYLARKGVPSKPADLRQHDFIFYTRMQQQRQLRFGTGKQAQQLNVRGKLIINSVSAIRKLVEAGEGMHLGPVWAFREGLESGQLVSVLPDYPQQSFPLHALYLSTAYVPAKIRQFIDRLAKRCQDNDFLA